ncbi:MAG: tetratricopeptide repeat protein, partial [bacterium]|nr:tetratricopeptide repeat protein [bacterium]
MGLLALPASAQDDWSSILEFRDVSKSSKYLHPLRKSKPWQEEEKQTVLKYFQLIRDRAPGLLQRAAAHRLIQVYRIGYADNLAKTDDVYHTVFISDSFFRDTSKDEPGSGPFHVLTHELVHLADFPVKIAWSQEWIKLVGPRMDRMDAVAKERGVSVSEAWQAAKKRGVPGSQVRSNLMFYDATSRQLGFPSLYATRTVDEALAEYTAFIVANPGRDYYGNPYSMPQPIQAFIQSKLLSTPVPDLSVRYYRQGLAALAKEELDEAIHAFDEAIKRDARLDQAYYHRGNAWTLKDELDQSIADYTQAIRLLEDIGTGTGKLKGLKTNYIAISYRGRAEAYFKKGEYDRSIADLTETIKVKAYQADSYYNRGRVWLKKKEYDKAIADLNEAIKRMPNARAYAERGRSWALKGEYDKAIADYSVVIKLKPWWSGGFYNRGRAWLEKEEYDKAIADLNEAIKRRPTDKSAYFRRGLAWNYKKEYDKAIADYKTAIRLKPDYARGHSNLGDAY